LLPTESIPGALFWCHRILVLTSPWLGIGLPELQLVVGLGMEM